MPTKTRKAKRINFTKSAIEALKPPASGRIYVYDTKTPGLAICVTKAGSKTFYIYRKVDGKPERIRIAPWPDITVEQARKHADRHNGAIAEGKNPNDQRRANREAMTLKNVYLDFLDQPTRTKSKRIRSEKTIHDYKQQYNSCLAEWDDRRITKITRKDIEALHTKLGEENGIYQANRVLSLITGILNYAVDQEYLEVNPASRLRKFTEQTRDRYLEADEFPQFWKALEAEPSEKIRDFFKMALFTGQRRMNVQAMLWEDISFQSETWVLPKTKGGKHSVPLIGPAMEILRRRKADAGDNKYVFPGRHGFGHLTDPRRGWESIKKRAGIENLRIHDLRRSMGSWQAITGSSLPVIGGTLGHKQAQTTAIYARLSSDPVRESMQTATEAMMQAAKPKKDGE
jgi:integrase